MQMYLWSQFTPTPPILYTGSSSHGGGGDGQWLEGVKVSSTDKMDDKKSIASDQR